MHLKERGFTVGDLIISFLIIFLGLFIFIKVNESKNKTVNLLQLEIHKNAFINYKLIK